MKKHNTAKNKMNQLHVDILGISELQWTRTGHFQSEYQNILYIYIPFSWELSALPGRPEGKTAIVKLQ